MNIWTHLEETKTILGKLQDLEGYFTLDGYQMEAKADGNATLVCKFVHGKEEDFVVTTSARPLPTPSGEEREQMTVAEEIASLSEEDLLLFRKAAVRAAQIP